MARFLFSLVVEGLGGLIKNVVFDGKVRGLKVRINDFVISHLQYANDTHLVGEAYEENLSTMKVILRSFESVLEN